MKFRYRPWTFSAPVRFGFRTVNCTDEGDSEVNVTSVQGVMAEAGAVPPLNSELRPKLKAPRTSGANNNGAVKSVEAMIVFNFISVQMFKFEFAGPGTTFRYS